MSVIANVDAKAKELVKARLQIPSSRSCSGDPSVKVMGRNLTRVVSLDNLHENHYCFSDCIHNRVESVRVRVFEQLTKAEQLVDKAAIVMLKSRAIELSYKFQVVEPYTEEQVLKTLNGGQRKLYTRMYEQHPFPTLKQSDVDFFVKTEAYEPIKQRVARPISPRHPAMRAFMARFFKPIEKRMKDFRGFDRHPFMAKGRDQVELAALFLAKVGEFKQPAIISLDMTKFDGHVTDHLLKVENAFYSRVVRNRRFSDALQHCLVTRGKLGEGATYAVRGGRCSGDQQTGLGNTFLMYLMSKGAFRCRTEVFANGDDTEVILEMEDWLRVQHSISSNFALYGMEVKIDGVDTDPYNVRWCQSMLVPTSPPKWIRDPSRVVSTLMRSTRYGEKDTYSRMKATLQGEMALAQGVAPMMKLLSIYMSKLDGVRISVDELRIRGKYQNLNPKVVGCGDEVEIYQQVLKAANWAPGDIEEEYARALAWKQTLLPIVAGRWETEQRLLAGAGVRAEVS